MDIELLRTFLEVERRRHFGKAASDLFVTQSAVSARIRQLEQTLGMPLFTRHRNNIQLTPEGQRLKKHAETIVQAWSRARQETGLREEYSGGLAVGAVWDLWENLLNEWLHRMRREAPETALRAESDTTESLIRKLADGVLDLVFLFEPPQKPDLEFRELAVFDLVMAATRRGLGVEEAFELGYIMVDWGTAFGLSHARLLPGMQGPALRMNLGSLARRYLMQADGAAYLPRQALTPRSGGRRLYPVKGAPVIERPVYAVFRSGSDREAIIRDALALL